LTDCFTDAEESSPKCNLNETFKIKDENIEVTPSLKMQGCNRTSTPSGKWYYLNLRKRSY
jgi:hypothetical protein